MTREEMNPAAGSDRWTDLLSDYLDGELSPGERRDLEEHVAGCGACRAALEGLRAVVERAPALREDEEPPADLWPAIQGRLRPRRSRWGWLRALAPGEGTASAAWWRPAMAAAIVVLAVAAGLLFTSRGGQAPAPAPAGQASGEAPAPGRPQLDARPIEASREYYDTLAQLQQAARVRLAHDPRVVELLEQNLEVLDVAIAQYADALAEQPGDPRLASRLEGARQRKIDVLRQAVDLAEAGN